MNADYKRHAYARTIITELQRHLVDRFMTTTDAPAKAQLVCEEVFFADREIPQEALHDVLELLQRLEMAESQQMQEYRMERRAPLPSLRPEQPREQLKKRKHPLKTAGKPASSREDRGAGSGSR